MLDNIRATRGIFINYSAPKEDWRDLSSFLVRFHTRKSLSAEAGTWEVMLTPAPNPVTEIGGMVITKDNFESFVYRSIRPMDMVLIAVEAPDPDTSFLFQQDIMVGFVDNVYKTKWMENNHVQRGIAVRGRDATKLFITDNIVKAPTLATDPDVVKAFGKNALRLQFMDLYRGGTKEDNIFADSYVPRVIQWILANMPAMRLRVDDLGGVKEPLDFFRSKLLAYAEDKVLDYNMNKYAGSIINYMQAIIDEPFYDLWIDTLPAKTLLNDTDIARPCLFLRPKPYDHDWEIDSDGISVKELLRGVESDESQSDGVRHGITLPTWEQLTCPVTNEIHEIGEEEYLEVGLGVSDEEMFTLYRVFGDRDLISASELGEEGFNYPLVDVGQMKNFGLREFLASTKMAPRTTEPFLLSEVTDEDLQKDYLGFGISFNRNLLKKTVDGSYSNVIDMVKTSDPDLGAKSVQKCITSVKRDRVWRWNRYNHIMESGKIKIWGRNVFVGSKVVLKDEKCRGLVTEDKIQEYEAGMEFQVLTVDQNWQFLRGWDTTLSLNRGHHPQQIQDYAKQANFDKRAGVDNDVYKVQTETILGKINQERPGITE